MSSCPKGLSPPSSFVFPTQSPFPAVPVVGYVGGGGWDATFRWTDRARLCHYDALIAGFVHRWAPNARCHAPTEPGLDALPALLTNACVQRGPSWEGKPAWWGGCELTVCGGCGEGAVGADVLSFQESGGRVHGRTQCTAPPPCALPRYHR